jgi:hypothetical protein
MDCRTHARGAVVTQGPLVKMMSQGEMPVHNPERDLEIAEKAIPILKRLRLSAAGVVGEVQKQLGDLAREIGKATPGDRQAEAFLAVQRIRQTLDDDPISPNLQTLWNDAVAKAEAWHRWLNR